LQSSLKDTALKILSSHPELTSGVGFGLCLNLPQTSVVSVARQQEMPFPEKCLGITFRGRNEADAFFRARRTLKTNNALISGREGSAWIRWNGRSLKVPICMETFPFGGPQ